MHTHRVSDGVQVVVFIMDDAPFGKGAYITPNYGSKRSPPFQLELESSY